MGYDMKDKRILILFLTIFIDLLGFGIVIPILPMLAKTLAAQTDLPLSPDVSVGLVAGVFSLMQFIFAPLLGAWSDRVGRRPIILISILINALGYFLFGLAGTFYALLISRLVSGFGSANLAAAQAYIADITSPEERASRMGIIGAAFGLGFVFGPPLGGWMFHLGGDNGLFWLGSFSAGLCLLNFVLAWFLLPESLSEKSVKKRSPLDTFKGMGKALKLEVISELMVINFLYIAAFSMMNINASILWEEHYGLSKVAIGNIFGLIGVCTAIVQGGLIRHFQRILGLKKMLMIGAPMVAIGLTIMPLPSKENFYLVQVIAVLLLSVGNGMLMSSINSLVSINTPKDIQGQMLGSMQSIGSLARSIGPLFAGYLYLQHFTAPYWMGGLLMLAVWVLALLLSRRLVDAAPKP